MIGVFIPAADEVDVQAAMDGVSFMVLAVKPTTVVSGLDGSLVGVVSVPTEKAWTMEIQTQQ